MRVPQPGSAGDAAQPLNPNLPFEQSEVCFDLEPILGLVFSHNQFFVVEIKLHGFAVVQVAGQPQQQVHPLLLLLGVEQVAGALLAGTAGAADAVGVVLVLDRKSVV